MSTPAPPEAALARPAAPASPSLAVTPRLSRWLTFTPDGTVAVHTGKVELGQGILTALAQIVADELGVGPHRVRVAAASTLDAPDEGYTSGSLSVQHSGAALRQVCAETRVICAAAAAEVLATAAVGLRLVDGVFTARDGGCVSYWDLPTDDLLQRDVGDDATTQVSRRPNDVSSVSRYRGWTCRPSSPGSPAT